MNIKTALQNLLDNYLAILNSGDLGNLDPETEQEVIDARAALEGFNIEDGQDFFVVSTNTDCTEGRGAMIPIVVSSSKSAALRKAKGKYIMGSDAPVRAIKSIKINNRNYLPVDCIPLEYPNKEDLINDKEFLERQLAETKKKEALKKAKDLGLSDDDLKALSS